MKQGDKNETSNINTTTYTKSLSYTIADMTLGDALHWRLKNAKGYEAGSKIKAWKHSAQTISALM